MTDDEFNERAKATKYVVRATCFEQHMLWSDWSDQSMNPLSKERCQKWQQMNTGCMVTVGYIADRPICICLSWNKIDGEMVMFVDPTSELVDHKMIDEWLRKHCNPMVDGRRAIVDATNYHLIAGYIMDKR